jgi:hypothetical protein
VSERIELALKVNKKAANTERSDFVHRIRDHELEANGHQGGKSVFLPISNARKVVYIIHVKYHSIDKRKNDTDQ